MCKLKIFALGGLGEFGKNLLVVQQDQDAIIVDCGALFSDGRSPGIDIIIPDFSPLLDPDVHIHALLLTHAHEDHIGSVPYFLHERNVPVYGTRFTHALVKNKCEQFSNKLTLDFRLISDHQSFDIGPFHITAVPMAHSIVEALGFFIDTRLGSIFHTGDFKMDPAPADGRITDLDAIAKIASSKKMLLLTSDSTNVMVPGESLAETSIQEGIQSALDQTQGKLVVTSFASHVPRIMQLCQLAQKNDRKVLLLGRSIIKNIELAKAIGHMHVPEDLFVDEQQATQVRPSNLMILATGTQAEPRAAMSKLVFGQFKGLTLGEHDRVVFSSRAIPGHERSIYHLINHIIRTGADVWTWENARVHVSGHGYREDLRQMIEAVKPEYMLPVHGELRMLKAHRALAIETGMTADQTFFIENGDVLEFTDKGVTQLPRIELFPKMVDQGMLVEMSASYLKDRKKLALQGAVAVMMTIDPDTFELMHPPFAEEVGFVDASMAQEVLDAIEDQIEREMIKLAKKPFHGNLEQQVRTWVNRVCRRHLDRKPIIIPIIVEV
ncbi:MAG: ribonuclease J [Bdellovibrionota bacterium]